MSTVKYRTNNPGLSPRRTRLTIPGWGGASEPRANGSHEQPWHCIPFSEAATAGIELFYPYEDELHVRGTAAGPVFSGNALGTPDMNAEPPPFRSFGKPYYTYQCLIDLKVEAGYAIKVETHPRFYTDTTGTVPIAVPALIRHWWPMIFFVVFKTPLLGQTHIFSPGEPFIQMSVVEADAKLRTHGDARGGSGGARSTGRAHLRQPKHSIVRYTVDLIHGYRLRWDLPEDLRGRQSPASGKEAGRPLTASHASE